MSNVQPVAAVADLAAPAGPARHDRSPLLPGAGLQVVAVAHPSVPPGRHALPRLHRRAE
jgi:hypothetical protein